MLLRNILRRSYLFNMLIYIFDNAMLRCINEMPRPRNDQRRRNEFYMKHDIIKNGREHVDKVRWLLRKFFKDTFQRGLFFNNALNARLETIEFYIVGLFLRINISRNDPDVLLKTKHSVLLYILWYIYLCRLSCQKFHF